MAAGIQTNRLKRWRCLCITSAAKHISCAIYPKQIEEASSYCVLVVFITSLAIEQIRVWRCVLSAQANWITNCTNRVQTHAQRDASQTYIVCIPHTCTQIAFWWGNNNVCSLSLVHTTWTSTHKCCTIQ